MMKHLKAGVSMIDITPPEGVELAGYPHCPRNNTGVHDPLFASCIYLDDGSTELALVSMDLLMYSKKYVRIARERVSEITGIPPGNIAIFCSHTHSAPWTSGRLDLEALEKGLKPDEDYISDLENKLVSLIEEASRYTFDAKIGFNRGYCGKEQGVGGNRRIPGGPADPEVCVVGVQDVSGIWRGCLVKYALHPTVIHSESTLVTADYPAYIREYLSKTKPGMKLLFAQGTSGDQSTRYFRNGQSFEEACRVGTSIGLEVDKVLNSMPLSEDAELFVRSVETDLELRILPEISVAEENVRKAEKELETLKSLNAPYINIRNAELKLLGAEDILGYVRLAEKGIKPELLVDEIPVEIQVIGLGDCRIVGIQGEMFVELGLKIKNESPFENTFVIELANGVLPGYAYTREALKEGGYETDTSMLSERSGEILVEKALELLNHVRGG
jgi:neutral ceramidase